MPRSSRINTVGDGVLVNTREMKNFGKALRKASPMLSRQFRTNLRKAGAIIRDKAKVEAGQHSSSIPPTIRMTGTGTNLYIQAGSSKVPLAALYELGNAPNRKTPDSATLVFRHPIFGEWVTGEGEQTGYPFLARSIEGTAEEVERLILQALDTAVHEIAFGFKA